ncbi:MAG: sugar phosphate isomerase/epimerase [Verrucomicrobiales bacterium]|jgi:sugar phosphate isomerase/epimerase|nr:sugar phosphate isomerase/epimerase [Verrucomicrobiales bacterium]
MPLPDLAISTSWNSARHIDGLAMLEELAALGFKDIELSHGIRYSLWPGILKALDQKIVRVVSLHNFCPLPVGFLNASPNCYEFTDPRRSRRGTAVRLTLETIDHAAAFGARAVVLHLGSQRQRHRAQQLVALMARGELGSRAYVRKKIAAVREHETLFRKTWPWLYESLLAVCDHARHKNIRLGFESREAVEEIPLENQWDLLLNEFPDAGYWHDFGHTAQKDALGFLDHAAELRKRRPRLLGCHLQDFRPPDHDHLPLGEGVVPFPELLPLLESEPLCVLELSSRVKAEKVRASVMRWRQWQTLAVGSAG